MSWLFRNPGNYLQRSEIIASLGIKISIRYNHRSAVVLSPDSKIGYNTLLMPNVVIGCGVKIGNHCIVLSNTVIAHDNTLGIIVVSVRTFPSGNVLSEQSVTLVLAYQSVIMLESGAGL